MSCDARNHQIVIIANHNDLYCFSPAELVRMINDNPPNVVEMKIANFSVSISELAKGLKSKYNTFRVGSQHLNEINRSSLIDQGVIRTNPTVFLYMTAVPDYIEDRKRFWNRYEDRMVIIPERYNVSNLEKLIREEAKIIDIYAELGKRFNMEGYRNILRNVNLETGLSYVWYSYSTNDPTMFPTRMLAQYGAYQMMHRNMRTYMGYFDYYYDIDVANAHPSIAIQWLERYADLTQFPTLVRYATDRQSMFDVLFAPPYNLTRDLAKRLLLEVFNSKTVQKKMVLKANKIGEEDVIIKNPPNFLFDLYLECIRAQAIAVSKFPEKYEWYIAHNVGRYPWFRANKEGVMSKYLLKKARVHCWQTMLTYVENLCLYNMWNSLYDMGYNPRTLIFDGLGVEKHPDLDPNFELSRNVLDTLSNLIFERCGYRIKLEIKGPPPVLPKLEQLFLEQETYVENVMQYNSPDLSQSEIAIVKYETEHNISYEDMIDTSANIGRTFSQEREYPFPQTDRQDDEYEHTEISWNKPILQSRPRLFPEGQDVIESRRRNESAYDAYLRSRE